MNNHSFSEYDLYLAVEAFSVKAPDLLLLESMFTLALMKILVTLSLTPQYKLLERRMHSSRVNISMIGVIARTSTCISISLISQVQDMQRKRNETCLPRWAQIWQDAIMVMVRKLQSVPRHKARSFRIRFVTCVRDCEGALRCSNMCL